MQQFKSKVDLWLALLVFAPAVLIPVVPLWTTGITGWQEWLLAGLCLLFVGWIYLTTRYSIEESSLRIVSGPVRKRIPVSEITSVKPARPIESLLASPALSLDRLMLRYGPGRQILVSPEDKDAFVSALRSAGADI